MNIRKLGLIGILASGIALGTTKQSNAQYPPVIYEPVPSIIIGSSVILEPQIIIESPRVIYVPATPIKKSFSFSFDIGKLEPGDYTTVIERREGVCDILDSNWNFSMNPTSVGRITPNSKLTTSWNFNSSGHYEIFVGGSGRIKRLGCRDLNSGDKISFVKTSQSFDSDFTIQYHPYESGKFLIKKDPLPKKYSTTPLIRNQDGSFELKQ